MHVVPTETTYLCGGIDDRNEFFDVSAEQAVVQDPVLVLQALHERVFADGLGAGAELVVRPFALLL